MSPASIVIVLRPIDALVRKNGTRVLMGEVEVLKRDLRSIK